MSNNLENPKVAYFSRELGIRNDIPTYSGGLGVLAGDVIRSSADLMVPMVAVTLASRNGYLKQKITPAGDQLESPDVWEPAFILEKTPATVEVKIENRQVKVQSWIYRYKSPSGGGGPIFFLEPAAEGKY